MIETELKFLAPDAASLHRLLSATRIAGHPVLTVRSFDQTDTYWDSPSRGIAELGGSLRGRVVQGDGDLIRLYTLKLKRVGVGRIEIEEPAGEWSARDWYAQCVKRHDLRGLPSPDLLETVVQVENRRTVLLLDGLGGRQIEVALDEVEFRGPYGESREWELELELVGGEPPSADDLDALNRAGAEAAKLANGISTDRSKYARALTAVGG